MIDEVVTVSLAQVAAAIKTAGGEQSRRGGRRRRGIGRRRARRALFAIEGVRRRFRRQYRQRMFAAILRGQMPSSSRALNCLRHAAPERPPLPSARRAFVMK